VLPEVCKFDTIPTAFRLRFDIGSAGRVNEVVNSSSVAESCPGRVPRATMPQKHGPDTSTVSTRSPLP
jgi:hypothetical protein